MIHISEVLKTVLAEISDQSPRDVQLNLFKEENDVRSRRSVRSGSSSMHARIPNRGRDRGVEPHRHDFDIIASITAPSLCYWLSIVSVASNWILTDHAFHCLAPVV